MDKLNVFNEKHKLFKNLKFARQRAKKGFCELDVWDIRYWFSRIMPDILQEYRDKHISIPSRFVDEYYEINKDKMTMSYDEYMAYYPRSEVDRKIINGIDDYVDNRWNEILDRMIFLFNEYDDEKCTMKNEYEDEYHVLLKDFEEKYGFLGEKLLTKEEKEEEKKKGTAKAYYMWQIDEYKEFYKKYSKRQKEIDEYQEKCKAEALDMFVKYFDDLWD